MRPSNSKALQDMRQGGVLAARLARRRVKAERDAPAGTALRKPMQLMAGFARPISGQS